MAEELDRVAKDTITMLQQAIQALNDLDAELARSTMVLEESMEHNLDVIYAELIANPDRDAVKYLLAVFAVFTQLKQGLQEPLNGMGTAFSYSLFGLGGSLVLGFLPHDFNATDNDSDGVSDMAELFVNMISLF